MGGEAMDEIVIRGAAWDERDRVFSLLRGAALSFRARGIDYWQNWLDPPPAHVGWIDDGLRGGEFFMVVSNGDVIGCFRLQSTDVTFWGVRTEPTGYVHSMTIDRSFAGQGVGRMVLQMIESRLAADGDRFLRLDCGSDVVGLRRYYESCGFQAVGEVNVGGEKLVLYEKSLAHTA
jgi:ribosomal protein S18 acetylase RimI-like enzyme